MMEDAEDSDCIGLDPVVDEVPLDTPGAVANAKVHSGLVDGGEFEQFAHGTIERRLVAVLLSLAPGGEAVVQNVLDVLFRPRRDDQGLPTGGHRNSALRRP